MGAEVDVSDAYGWTPLMFAAKTGASDLIRMFLELNADINQEDKSGNTALLLASACFCQWSRSRREDSFEQSGDLETKHKRS